MVDNENQWEDTEYSEVEDDSQDYDYEEDADETYEYEEYSDDSNDQEYDYEEYEEESDASKKNLSPIIAIVLLLILLAVGGIIFYSKFVSSRGVNAGNLDAGSRDAVEIQTEQQSSTQSTEELAEAFFAEAGGNSADMMSLDFGSNGETNVITGEGADASVATVTEMEPSDGVSESDLFEDIIGTENVGDDQEIIESQENDSIMVVYNKAARINPFKPPVLDKVYTDGYDAVNNTEFEIIEPPVQSVPDENLTKLLQTQISGILFDEESPSAIVNLNGVDNFVKTGDVVSGYTIDNITRDKVQVSYRNNSYIASVGELFTRGALEKQRAVVNLESKFAGRYKNDNKEE